MRDKIVDLVRDDLQRRSSVGIEKYKTTLETNNYDNFLNHHYEELLDAALYVKKQLHQKDYILDLIEKYPNDAELGNIIRKTFTRW